MSQKICWSVTMILSLLAATAFAQTPDNKTEQEVEKVTEAFRVAYLHRDADAIAQMLTDDFLIVSNPAVPGVDKTRYLAGLKQPLPSPQRWDSYEFSEIVRHYYGDTLVTFTVATLKGINPNNEPFTSRARFTTTSVKRQGRWQIVAIHGSPIPIERAAAKVDPKLFDAYAGQYQFPSSVITVTREGDKLFWQSSTATTKVELIPASETAFFVRGSQNQNIFVKDETGQVAHIKQVLVDGREARFKKIK
jgi:ketosteroid isomerase-like protein